MKMVLSSQPRMTYARTPANGRDVMSNVISGGIVLAAEAAVDEADLPFVPVTLPVERRARPPIVRQMQNATFAISLGMSVFGPAPTLAANPLGLGWSGTLAGFDTLQTVDGVCEPLGGSQHLAVLNDQIEKFVTLPAGWDGDDGVAPSTVAGDHAKAFLVSLATADLPHECRAVGDGEIILQWKSLESFIEVAFEGATVSWYARIGEAQPVFGDDPFNNVVDIDARLMNAISAIR